MSRPGSKIPTGNSKQKVICTKFCFIDDFQWIWTLRATLTVKPGGANLDYRI